MVLADPGKEIKKFLAATRPKVRYVLFEADGFWYMVPEQEHNRTTVLMHTEKEGNC